MEQEITADHLTPNAVVRREQKSKKGKTFFGLLGFLMLAGGLALVQSSFWNQNIVVPANLQSLSPDAQTAFRTQLLSELGDILQIPDDPVPIIARVSDSEQLKNEQAFYRHAVDGDALVVFPESQMAVIYRPAEHKIINAGTLIFNE